MGYPYAMLCTHLTPLAAVVECAYGKTDLMRLVKAWWQDSLTSTAKEQGKAHDLPSFPFPHPLPTNTPTVLA